MPALNTKTEDTTPSSDDILYAINDPAGTPTDRKVTAGNLITKAHGLGDGYAKITTGVMGVESAATLKTGLSLVKADVGLGNVDNTSDTAKPVSTATQAALDLKSDTSHTHLLAAGATDVTATVTELNYVDGVTSPIQTQLDGKSSTSHTHDDSAITAAASATNYTPSASTVEGHLSGIDTALASAGGGGQTLYTTIVDAAGAGDYTSLVTAIAAASAGDSIFVRAGTYTSAADVTTSLADLTIVGESNEKTIISLGVYDITFSGARVTLRNLRINGADGYIMSSATNFELDNCRFYHTTDDPILYLTSTYYSAHDCLFDGAGAYSTNDRIISVTGNSGIISNCIFHFHSTLPGSNTLGGIQLNGAYAQFLGNTVLQDNGSGTNTMLIASEYSAVISDNTFRVIGTAGGRGIQIASGADNTIISNNNFVKLNQAVYTHSDGAGNVVMNGNMISSATTGAITLTGGCYDWIISNNQIYGTSGDGIDIQSSAVARHMISGNRISGFVNAIDITNAAATKIVVSSNVLIGNTAGITTAAPDTIDANNVT